MNNPSNDKETITTTEWCVLKNTYSEPYLCRTSRLFKDELEILERTVELLKNDPKAVLSGIWITPVPAQLNALASEIFEICEDNDRGEANFGFELLNTLMEHERSSHVKVLQAMLPKIIWKVSDDFSIDLRKFYEFYHHGEAVDELIKELTTDPGFPDTIKLVIDMMYKTMSLHHDCCLSRDEEIRMAIDHANGVDH